MLSVKKNLLVFYLDEVQTILCTTDTLYVTENTNHIKLILVFRLFFKSTLDKLILDCCQKYEITLNLPCISLWILFLNLNLHHTNKFTFSSTWALKILIQESRLPFQKC